MKPYSSLSGIALRCGLALIVLLVNGSVCTASSRSASGKTAEPALAHGSSPLARSGFEYFYNMEYDKAIRDFTLDVQQHPDDPAATNHLLSAVLFKELYRIGALDTELYASDSFLSARQFDVDPKVRERVRQLTDRALALAEKRLRANPNDVDALYERGVAKATRATALGLMDKAWISALRSAIGARRDHERVLELDPNYSDAKMVVGVHYYILGSLSWAIKVAASVVGLSGNRAKGIQYLYEASGAGGENGVNATIALSLFLRREQRYPEAIKLVGGLHTAYPHNFLVALEYPNLLNAAGRGPEAIAAYRKLLEEARSGAYQDPRLEQVSWGLGETLRGQRDFAGAAAAYESVGGFSHVEPELLDRANLAAGEMYDLLQERALAIKKYQQVVATAGDSPRAGLARKYLKQPYHPPKG
jgi:tetratricopeptide (TPR) repeat protein